VVLGLGGLVCLSSGATIAEAAEFYSWIDPGGTMVMTDDPSHIPPAATRSPISIHRFQEVTETEAVSDPGRKRGRRPTAGPREQAGKESEVRVPIKARPARPEAPSKSDVPEGEEPLPPVLLDGPEESVRTQYLWVPLLAPVYVGGNQVSGFWCHRTVSSPVDAFKRFLGQHLWPRQRVLVAGGQLQLNNVFNGPPSSVRPGTGNVRGPATPIFDQVMRERQLLMERQGRQSIESHGPARPAGSGPGSLKGGHRGQLR
jgi:hypothetical protein